MEPQCAVTVVSVPQCCEVCSSSTHPGIVVAWLPGFDDHETLIPCPHCAGACWLYQLLEGK